MVLTCAHTLVLHNNTNSHTSLSSWFLESTYLDTLACSYLNLFHSFRLLVNFLKTTLLCDSLVPILSNFFLCQLSHVWCPYAFFHFPWSFWKLDCSSGWRSLSQYHFRFCSQFPAEVNAWLQPSFLIELYYSVCFL